MAEEAVADGTGRDPRRDGGAGVPSATGAPSLKTLACVVMLPTLLLGGLVAGGYALGLFAAPPPPAPAHAPAEGEVRPPARVAVPLYYELPDLMVELETGSEVPALLKIAATLEVEDEATLGRLHTVMPRVLDNFQVYLSELGPEDLQGAAGFDRVSEALLLRVNASIGPAKVQDLRLLEVLVQ